MNKYILDTNIFDYLLDNRIEISNLKNIGEFYSTNVQLSEIKNITNEQRKNELLEIYKHLNPQKLLLRSGIWIDKLYWDDDQIWIDDIQDEAISLLGNSQENKPWRDALIGEIVKFENMILVTNDKGF